MKKVLVLGAGMVARPIVHYLLDNNIEVALASRTKERAEKAFEGYSNAKAVAWTIGQLDVLEELVKSHDLTVRLLPYKYHVVAAERCIADNKNMITTS